jgi:hypothetical protein
MATSRVPAVLDALLAACRAASDLTGVAIVDGPPLTDLTNPDQVFIGWQPSADDVAAADAQDFAQLGAQRRDEQIDIRCYAESRSGDTVIKTVRDRAYALVGAVENLLRADATLAGTVLWTHLVAGDLRQPQTDAGALAGVEFAVHARARI